jgi:subtilisin family serine protease
VDTNGDQLITFHDLNAPVNAPYVSDGNGNGYIDAGDLLRPLAAGGWEDGLDGPGAANGFIDDLVGWDFVNDDNKPLDDHGHGTHTAGIIGAMGNNSLGVVGVAWSVQIMVVKFISAADTADMADAPRSITYAAANGARVSNNSWGTTGLRNGDALYNAIKSAGEQYGHIVVAAAMNNGLDNDKSPFRSYPASYDLPNIITVAATDSADKLARWSNYGKVSVDLAAPGVDILSTLPGGQYGYGSGTSMAAPFVTGTIALMLSIDPGLLASEVKLFLLDAVDPVSGLSKKIASGGRLNIDAAVGAVA